MENKKMKGNEEEEEGDGGSRENKRRTETEKTEKRRKAKVKVNECHLIPFLCNRRIDLEIFTQWCSGIPHTK